MTDPITPAEIARLRELMRKATPGPWHVDGGREWADIRSENGEITGSADPWCGSVPAADADLIVAAVNALPALLTQLDAQAAEIERLRAAMLSALAATRAKVDGSVSADLLCMGADEIRLCIKRLEAELILYTNGAQCRMEERDAARNERESYKRRLIEAEDSLAVHHRRADKAEARARELDGAIVAALAAGVGDTGVDCGRGGGPCRYCEEKDEVLGAALATPTAAGAAGGEVEIERRCPHGIRHPHPCRECEDAIPQSEVDAFRMKMEADKAAGGEVAP